MALNVKPIGDRILVEPVEEKEVKKGLDIIPVQRMDEVLERALTRKPEAITWDEEAAKLAEAAAAEKPVVEDDGSGLTAH